MSSPPAQRTVRPAPDGVPSSLSPVAMTAPSRCAAGGFGRVDRRRRRGAGGYRWGPRGRHRDHLTEYALMFSIVVMLVAAVIAAVGLVTVML